MTAPVDHSVDLDFYRTDQPSKFIFGSGLTMHDSVDPTQVSSGASGKGSTINGKSKVCDWTTAKNFIQTGQMMLIAGSLFMVSGTKNFGLEDSTSFWIGLGGLVLGGVVAPSLVSLKDKVEKVREANMKTHRFLW